MNARTFSGSFLPGRASTPEETSTPQGFVIRMASPTFSGFSPPARTSRPRPLIVSNDFIAPCQSNVWPVPPSFAGEANQPGKHVRSSVPTSSPIRLDSGVASRLPLGPSGAVVRRPDRQPADLHCLRASGQRLARRRLRYHKDRLHPDSRKHPHVPSCPTAHLKFPLRHPG